MGERLDTIFAAVITLEPPETQGKAAFTITLRPTDEIDTDGTTKLLRDCTLEELQRYADRLEARFWSENRHRTLADLLADESIEVELAWESMTELQGQPGDSNAAWLDQIVLLDPAPEAAVEAAVTIEPEADARAVTGAEAATIADTPPAAKTDAPAVLQTDDAAPPTTPAPDATGSAPDDRMPATGAAAAADAAAADAATDTTERDADDDNIVVDASEPVYVERDRAEPPATAAPTAKPATRILGLLRRAGHPTTDAVDILLHEPALRTMQQHALSSLNREVAGFMLGKTPEKQPDGRYVVEVSDAIIAQHTEMRGASVTYTPESWRYAQDRIAERYPAGDHVMVGWYHTHPGFGIFLSNMDLFIHQNFFTQKWHIAYVLDPRAARSGFFCWNRVQTQVQAYSFPWPAWARDSW